MTETKSDKRFKVIAIHPWTGGCGLNCSFCYKSKKREEGMKTNIFWFNCVPYLKELTDQIALGADGEPFMNVEFVKSFSKKCKENGLICNVTTNGRKLMEMSDEDLKKALENITMLSISFDKEKCPGQAEMNNYFNLVKRIKALTKSQALPNGMPIGCNLLVNEELFLNKGMAFISIAAILYACGVDRIFALYPKNQPMVDITKENRLPYIYLTSKYPSFFVDDLTKEILEQGYSNWNKPCHYGKDIVSINEYGVVTGCSFDSSCDGLMSINEPKDLLTLKTLEIKERTKCPYLKECKEAK